MATDPEVPIRSYSISAFVCRRTGPGGEVLLMRRTGKRLGEIWCQVAGGIEDGETAWQAALREIREETGLVPDEFYSADICEQFYEPHRECVAIIPVFVAFVPEDAAVTLNPEHSEYRWMDVDEAERHLRFACQRTVLRHIEREFFLRRPNDLLRLPTEPGT
ncbi:MAG: NUDIX domain-containing protein [Planctomycetota bacterium]